MKFLIISSCECVALCTLCLATKNNNSVIAYKKSIEGAIHSLPHQFTKNKVKTPLFIAIFISESYISHIRNHTLEIYTIRAHHICWKILLNVQYAAAMDFWRVHLSLSSSQILSSIFQSALTQIMSTFSTLGLFLFSIFIGEESSQKSAKRSYHDFGLHFCLLKFEYAFFIHSLNCMKPSTFKE